jgi:hypothetical protein
MIVADTDMILICEIKIVSDVKVVFEKTLLLFLYRMELS